jgi:hypothetical protein
MTTGAAKKRVRPKKTSAPGKKLTRAKETAGRKPSVGTATSFVVCYPIPSVHASPRLERRRDRHG